MEPLLFDLFGRAKLRITGGDRLRFLNGQITNDISKATESAAIEACVLSAKGKLNAHVFISTGPDVCFVDADAELRDKLPERLARYVIADDVEIENVSDAFSIYHLLGSEQPIAERAKRIISARRFNEPGWDIWVDPADRHSVLQQLSAKARLIDSTAAEAFRIEQGIPRWGRELTDEIIPIEANLESRTVDYEKGCYIGQEVISRIKMSGQTNKVLCGLVSVNGIALTADMRLFAIAEKEKEAGWITSAARTGNREIALAYVKRGFNKVGTRLNASLPIESGKKPALVEIVSLPFT